MKDVFLKSRLIVLLVCLILAILSSLAIYFINGNLIEKKDEKEVKGQSLEKIRSADEKLKKSLSRISFEISNYDIDENLAKRKNKLTDEKQRLDSEKEWLDEEDKRLKVLNKEIVTERTKLNGRLAKIKEAEDKVASEEKKICYEIKALAEKPDLKRLQELEVKMKELEPQKAKNKNDRDAYNKASTAFKQQKENTYNEALKEFYHRKKEYETRLLDYTNRKNKFDRDYAKEEKEFEELDALEEMKVSIENEISSNDTKLYQVKNEYNELDAEINSLSNLKQILFAVVLLLMFLFSTFLTLELKKKRLRQQPLEPKPSFDSYVLKQTDDDLINEDKGDDDFIEERDKDEPKSEEDEKEELKKKITDLEKKYEALQEVVHELKTKPDKQDLNFNLIDVAKKS